ncbi:MAG: hypothetical protein M1832_006209 [Thelocarpon impressellum]|nr:MAG: hypothetical protein M1832_006209 [Thelocarpon impressellum]
MHLQTPDSSGPAGPEAPQNAPEKPFKHFVGQSSSLPFGQHVPLSAVAGPTYLTAQTLIQQVAYTLSDKIFAYSPETFDLDVAARKWSEQGALNAHCYTTGVSSLQIRSGAASIALGYLFSKDFDLKKRHVPQTLLSSSAALPYLRTALDQLSLLYAVASPFVAHVAAVDYIGGSRPGLFSNYASPQTIAEDLGLALTCSMSTYETQHMALFSTLLASVLPALHVYDGVSVGRETVRVIDAMDQRGLARAYDAIHKEISGSGKRYANIDGRVVKLLESFNGELGTEYGLFEYHGHSSPEHVLVVFGTAEASLSSQVATALADAGRKVGVVRVRVYRPFVEEEFLKVLPASVRTITALGQVQDAAAVVDESVHSALYNDVLAAVTFSEDWTVSPVVADAKYLGEQAWTSKEFARLFQRLGRKDRGVPDVPEIRILDPSRVQQYTFWDSDASPSANAPQVLGQLLAKDSATNVTVKTTHDNLLQGGTVRTDIRDSRRTIEASYPVENADVVFVGEEKLLGQVEILVGIKHSGTLLVQLPAFKDELLEKRLPAGTRQAIAARQVKLFVLDPLASPAVHNDQELHGLLTQLAVLSVSRSDVFVTGLEKLSAINGNLEVTRRLAEDVKVAVRRVEVLDSWATAQAEVEVPPLPKDIVANSFAKLEDEEVDPPALLRTWEAAAKALAFKESYGTRSALRPDLATKTWTVHVKENRRLTPATYDRNIFHIEFDLGDSGLKYEMGESLGIHSENNEDDVREFIRFYGLEPENLVEVPSREDPTVLEVRTVYQSLMQNIDIFGRPPKKFYEALADFADDANEKKELLALGGPAGATEFKRRAEVDTITFADVLLEFRSARPSFHDIVRVVNPLKRREYSVASSQVVTPTSVALMVVVVGWVDPKGRERFGQATRYLWQLKPGAPVTVSVKPSVMKLPASPAAPIIMAGLGTGLAPFRAFVQYRAWQKAQGIAIGSVLLYMGSRHQREEYLYGEEWEAYRDAGVITLLGRAFSRDQPQKIYIQDRMRQTLPEIVQAYIKEQGAFYLCGPTWPVPDVTEVLQEAIVMEAGSAGKKVDARKEIERLKDDLRYVLEVY